MSISSIKTLFVAAALLLSVGATFATEQKVAAAQTTGGSVKPAVAASKPAAKKTSAVAKARLVDINSAGPNELKTLPGVTDTIAEKIIAGRPFGSKAQLTTRSIISREVYEGLKSLVVAKQDPGTTAKLLKK